MPLPGPRTQSGPVDGYRNPRLETPTRFNSWERPGPVDVPGETPGTMTLSLRGIVLMPGTIRKFWRQSVNLIAAQGPYSWSANTNLGTPPRAVGLTRALRYMTRSVSHTAGTDNTRFAGLHTTVTQLGRKRVAVTTGAGQTRSRPTVRNRISSFGARVPTLNDQVQADQGAKG